MCIQHCIARCDVIGWRPPFVDYQDGEDGGGGGHRDVARPLPDSQALAQPDQPAAAAVGGRHRGGDEAAPQAHVPGWQGGGAIDKAELAGFANRVGEGKMLTDVRGGAWFVSVGSGCIYEARGGGSIDWGGLGRTVSRGGEGLGRGRGEGMTG